MPTEDARRWRKGMTWWIIGFTAIVLYMMYSINNNSHRIDKTSNKSCRITMALMFLYINERDRQIDSPKNPLHAYYKEHKDSVRLAHIQNKYFLKQFNENQCGR